MGAIVRGAKAGGYPGIAIALASIAVNYYILEIRYREEISRALGVDYHPSLAGLILNGFLTAIVLTLCGILYALSYNRINLKPFWKSFAFGLAVFVASRIGDLIVDYPISRYLFLENALWSAFFLLLVWPYLTSRIYSKP